MNPNIYINQKERGLQRKLDAISSRGNACELCGYNKNLAALDWHHIDPSSKEFQLDIRHFSNTSLEKLKLEIDKCQLLCANCHRELHNPSLDLNVVSNRVIIPKLTFSTLSAFVGTPCEVCGTRFLVTKGKRFCSKTCRESIKNYPSIEDLNIQYSILKSWDEVARYFGITRRITQGIRKNAPVTQRSECQTHNLEVGIS